MRRTCGGSFHAHACGCIPGHCHSSASRHPHQYRARTPIYTSRGEFRSPYDSHVYFLRDRWYNVFRLSRPSHLSCHARA